jgi:hypothetical protein
MSDRHTEMEAYGKNLPVPTGDDGWSEAASEAAERTIRGTLLKFADWRWTSGKEAAPIADGTRLVALATAAMWQRWQGGKPVEVVLRQPGRRLPEREELSHQNQNEWEEGPNGERKDPWQNTRLVYLVDPSTAAAFTFSTSSWGGRGAVTDLADAIARMRTVYADAVPIVELRAAEMPTKYGRKSKPLFKIVGWKSADSEKALPVEREISPQHAKKIIDQREMDDKIPF